MEDSHFDVVILGTGLTESITAAALAKAGFKVAHIDENPYYGAQEASLSLDEFIQWADTSSSNPKFASITRSPNSLPQSRQYSICLRPSIIPSVGPIISCLVSSGVAKYGGFRLLERVGFYDHSGTIKNVPGTKEDVFKDQVLTLVDKRRLMRFLMFAVGDFETSKELEGQRDLPFDEFLKTVFLLNDEMTAIIIYSIAYCLSPSDPTLPALQRIRRYLKSAGRYGPSPFLVGHYGGTGDIAQGFCRAAAVSGGVYILGRQVDSIVHSSSFAGSSSPSPRYSVVLADFPDTLTCNVLISSASLVPSNLAQYARELSPTIDNEALDNKISMVRCVAIVDHPIYFPPSTSSSAASVAPEPSPPSSQELEVQLPAPFPLDTGLLVFPPSSIPGGSTTVAATVLVTGEGSMSTPAGKWILYIALPLPSAANTSSPQQILQPYLDATLALMVPPNTQSAVPPSQSPITSPLFTTFYVQHHDFGIPSAPDPSADLASTSRAYIVPPPLSPALPLPDIPDAAATHAETVFWETVKTLSEDGVNPAQVSANADTHEGVPTVVTFWPTVDMAESEDEEW